MTIPGGITQETPAAQRYHWNTMIRAHIERNIETLKAFCSKNGML